MTAPARSPRNTPGEATPRETRRAERTRTAGQRSTAAERAYARRAQRAEGSRKATKTGTGAGKAAAPARQRGFRLGLPKSRASFVLLVMVLLAAGIATTLLLSTQAIADSYRLEQIREENANLAEQSERLQRAVGQAGSPSSLAERAKALGMVPADDPAHLMVRPDGSIGVVGDPHKATAPVTTPPPPPAQTQPPGQTQPTGPGQGQPDQGQPAGQTQTPSPTTNAAPIEGDVAQGDAQQSVVAPPQTGGQ
ncbi:hypothetical protein ORV05_22000 [Amycolatopsis cynarae]|uniref:Cell division protein FtsL n=1 Tax=Amycolatopsis cynarae TaxID=2995223 RepID=A0ABY7AYI7_9PSEU|nr:hypothetical protein [Amycolatopsis sp. HUAS 11-8]WAL63668.1 hypothetical protein ORV05_22000 [Amycolatopsis sp. HUAS 11-8]